MSFAFLSEEFTARYHVPSYASWLARVDMQPAYDMHRLVLQILQRRCAQTRWMLKSPRTPARSPDVVLHVSRCTGRNHAPRPAHTARFADEP